MATVKSKKYKISRDRRGCWHAKQTIDKNFSAAELLKKLQDATGNYKTSGYGSCQVRRDVGGEVEILMTNDEKRCMIGLFQYQDRKRMILDMSVSGMLIHNAEVVENYFNELAEKIF